MAMKYDNPDSLAEALMTASLATKTESTTKPRKAITLPIPRELRDNIYQHLLLSERVKAAPYFERSIEQRQGTESIKDHREQSTAHTYKFETAILAVNHAIHKEANEVLQKNVLVVVSFDWPGFEEAKHTHDVPIVTEKMCYVARFANHSLRVHIRHPDWNLRAIGKQKHSSLLMLAVDLPQLCKMLQYTYFTLPSLAPLAVRPYSESDSIWSFHENGSDIGQNFKVVMKLQFRPTSSRLLTYALERSLLKPFEETIIDEQKIVISGNRYIG